MSSPNPTPIPSSILVIGSGVFGLSTALALAQRPAFQHTTLTLLERLPFPAHDGASIDSSRIIRPDYPDWRYAALMAEAHPHWRGAFGAEGRYSEAGLCLVSDEDGKGAAGYYLIEAMRTVSQTLGLKVGKREGGGQVEPLESAEDVRRVVASMGGGVGSKGYVNWTSGWADAEAGMMYMRKLAEKTGRIDFRTAEVKRLRFAEDRVEGVELANGELLTADLVVLAAGAWTPSLIDLRGIASASGQVLAYLSLSQEEQDRLGSNPTLLCEDSGMFIIPPRHRVLKVARHGYGYANPTTIPHPEHPSSSSSEHSTVSLPWTKQDDTNLQIPPEGDRACREFLARAIPDLKDRPWTHTRLCWYTDTRKGDWLIDFHPRYKNLFVVTGGSGHAYKFLPVVGERAVDILMRRDRDELGRELRLLWAWPEQRMAQDHVVTEDWRGGRKGMVLQDEYAKT